MEELNRFEALAHTGRVSLTDPSEQVGIDRRTGPTRWARYAGHGFSDLHPHSQPGRRAPSSALLRRRSGRGLHRPREGGRKHF